MQTIVIKTIPHNKQRYETVGDYFTTLGDLDGDNGQADGETVRQFRISDMGNPDYEFLVALHELIESHLVQKRGIPDAAIDEFDKEFEHMRKLGVVPSDAEPGNDVSAPYHQEHHFATLVERLVAAELGVDWDEYGHAVDTVGRARER